MVTYLLGLKPWSKQSSAVNYDALKDIAKDNPITRTWNLSEEPRSLKDTFKNNTECIERLLMVFKKQNTLDLP